MCQTLFRCLGFTTGHLHPTLLLTRQDAADNKSTQRTIKIKSEKQQQPEWKGQVIPPGTRSESHCTRALDVFLTGLVPTAKQTQHPSGVYGSDKLKENQDSLEVRNTQTENSVPRVRTSDSFAGPSNVVYKHEYALYSYNVLCSFPLFSQQCHYYYYHY